MKFVPSVFNEHELAFLLLVPMKAAIIALISFFLSVFSFKISKHGSGWRSKFSTILREIPMELIGQLDPSKSWTVKFKFQDKEKDIIVPEDTSLLEIGEKYFDDVPSSCRNGVCTTCSAKIVEGRDSIKLAVNGFGEDIIAQGYVCSCQSYAAGPGIVIELGKYDEVYEEQYGKYEQSYEMKFGSKKGDLKKGLF